MYKVHGLESSNKKSHQKKEDNLELIIYERLKSLVVKTCEAKVTKPIVFIDVIHSIKGTLINIDDQWVIILGKKDVQYLIRLTMVKDVAKIM